MWENVLQSRASRYGIVRPGAVLWDVHFQELGTAHSFYSNTNAPLTINTWCEWLLPKPTTISFCPFYIQEEIVVFVKTPLDQKARLIPVIGFIIVSNQAHYSHVVWKLDDVIGTGGWCTVVDRAQRAEHILWRTNAQHDGFWMGYCQPTHFIASLWGTNYRKRVLSYESRRFFY